MTTATHLRFEHLPHDPASTTFVGTATPRLGWWLLDGPQAAVRIEAVRNLPGTEPHTETVELDGADQVLVAWPFAPLASRERAVVRLQVRDDKGVWGEWSEPVVVEAALLEASDWTARLVRPLPDAPDPLPRPAMWLRGRITLREAPASARLYATAQGIYRAELNGRRVGDDELAPGWTSYTHRLRVQAHDVTELLKAGENVLGATLADGWHRGWYGFDGGRHNIYGREIGLLAQLEVAYADGSTEVFGTGEGWQSRVSSITSTSLYDGEHRDARLERPWSTAADDDSGWSSTTIDEFDLTTLFTAIQPPVRVVEELPVAEVITTPSGKTVLDFGQNIAGRVRICVTAPAGHVITLRHAEVLEHGELGTRPLRLARATDVFTAAGTGFEVFEPVFTIHGFRYVEVDGWPGELDPAAFTAQAMSSDLVRTGWWTSSHEGLNRLHENVSWSMRDNFVDVPTDCPQRDERMGWTGDISAFAPTATFLADTGGFLANWLEDLAVDQADLGTVPIYVPYVRLLFPPLPFALWGDAAVTVPFDHHRAHADDAVIERQFDSMCAWLDQVAQLAGASRLWDKDLQLGDWLDPTAPPENPAKAMTDPGLVATSFWFQSLTMLVTLGRRIGRDKDVERYQALADEVREAFRAEYVTASGRLMSDSQTAYALAIMHGLLDEQQTQRAGDRLAELISGNNFLIGTGFAGTPVVADALVRTGHLDEAYHLLLNDECPSWLYAVTMGATTTWERWDSMLPDGSINPGGMTSFNHYALGAIADFMHRVVGGLAIAEPGGRLLSIAPRPGGGLTSCETLHSTQYGDCRVEWTREDGEFRLHVNIPWGSEAEVSLPNGSPTQRIGAGQHEFSCPLRPADEDPQRPEPSNAFMAAFTAGREAWLKAVEDDGGPAMGFVADGPNF